MQQNTLYVISSDSNNQQQNSEQIQKINEVIQFQDEKNQAKIENHKNCANDTDYNRSTHSTESGSNQDPFLQKINSQDFEKNGTKQEFIQDLEQLVQQTDAKSLNKLSIIQENQVENDHSFRISKKMDFSGIEKQLHQIQNQNVQLQQNNINSEVINSNHSTNINKLNETNQNKIQFEQIKKTSQENNEHFKNQQNEEKSTNTVLLTNINKIDENNQSLDHKQDENKISSKNKSYHKKHMQDYKKLQEDINKQYNQNQKEIFNDSNIQDFHLQSKDFAEKENIQQNSQQQIYKNQIIQAQSQIHSNEQSFQKQQIQKKNSSQQFQYTKSKDSSKSKQNQKENQQQYQSKFKQLRNSFSFIEDSIDKYQNMQDPYKNTKNNNLEMMFMKYQNEDLQDVSYDSEQGDISQRIENLNLANKQISNNVNNAKQFNKISFSEDEINRQKYQNNQLQQNYNINNKQDKQSNQFAQQVIQNNNNSINLFKNNSYNSRNDISQTTQNPFSNLNKQINIFQQNSYTSNSNINNNINNQNYHYNDLTNNNTHNNYNLNNNYNNFNSLNNNNSQSFDDLINTQNNSISCKIFDQTELDEEQELNYLLQGEQQWYDIKELEDCNYDITDSGSDSDCDSNYEKQYKNVTVVDKQAYRNFVKSKKELSKQFKTQMFLSQMSRNSQNQQGNQENFQRLSGVLNSNENSFSFNNNSQNTNFQLFQNNNQNNQNKINLFANNYDTKQKNGINIFSQNENSQSQSIAVNIGTQSQHGNNIFNSKNLNFKFDFFNSQNDNNNNNGSSLNCSQKQFPKMDFLKLSKKIDPNAHHGFVEYDQYQSQQNQNQQNRGNQKKRSSSHQQFLQNSQYVLGAQASLKKQQVKKLFINNKMVPNFGQDMQQVGKISLEQMKTMDPEQIFGKFQVRDLKLKPIFELQNSEIDRERGSSANWKNYSHFRSSCQSSANNKNNFDLNQIGQHFHRDMMQNQQQQQQKGIFNSISKTFSAAKKLFSKEYQDY
ncbi:hypothetical protein PPERSA_12432 [Pseudocohnilembus persalinus]|uniref:Uncharacterized protein n=1 Tax=Pseudocohnilembus persalinus TaxID=266149 RepID=A0A0V0QPC9_PSEPJ|nr:hypothetical protein PPERSA_12432 [Pseudocohnilembus persalinus]|eukprot:KRX03985.1 hypothetical protein PPERSA_12432 [Pseudocohnilembus persalinus]